MWGFLKAAGLALAVANLRRRIRALAVKGMLAAAGFLFLVIAFCFFLVALHAWLSAAINPVASAAIIGGILLVIAAVLLYLASRPTATAATLTPPAIGRSGDAGWAHIAQSFSSGESPLMNPTLQAAALALLAGFFLGRRRPDRDKDDD